MLNQNFYVDERSEAVFGMTRVLAVRRYQHGYYSTLAAVLVGTLAAFPASAQTSAATAFVNVSVVPMDQERVLTGQTVIVRGDRIIAMGPIKRIHVPAGARRIDGLGKYLIPGLADMHAHVPGLKRVLNWAGSQKDGTDLFAGEGLVEAKRMLFLYLANGVTTVRILYGYGSPETLRLRAQAAKGELLSPRIYAAAGPLDMHGGPDPSPDSAIRFVETAKAAGYDLIKLHGVGGAAFDSAVGTAHRLGIPIAGHVPSDSGGLERAIRARYASIEHLTAFHEVHNEAKLRTLAIALQRAGIWSCPTLILNTSYADPPTPDAPELRYYRESSRQGILARLENRQKPLLSAISAPQPSDTIIKILHAAGVGFLLGTDAPAGGMSGFSVHRELEALVGAGLSPYEALLAGTRNVAAYLGTVDSTGTVAVGKRADLVLLTGNPLADIRHTAQPAGVMLGGRWFSRVVLDQLLGLLEGTMELP